MFPIRDSIKVRRFPWINWLLIIVNIAVFIKETQLAAAGQLDAFVQARALIPAHFFADPFLQLPTVFTAMFLHGGWAHVIGNMWFLHVFGDNVEDNMGPARYLFYYLMMGLGAATAQLLANPHSAVPMVGASGAIAGVLGGYFVLYPRAKVLTFFVFIILIKFIEVPALFYLGLWFLMQAANGVGSISAAATQGDTGGVAWWAHVGGFAAGFVFIPFFRKR